MLVVWTLYTGNIFTNFNAVLDESKDYTNSTYSLIVKVPGEYYSLADFLNSRKEDFRIAGMPYSIVNSENWMNFIKWKHIGSNPLQEIITKPLLSPNQKIGTWFPIYNFEHNKNLCEGWFLYYLSTGNIKYILYYKDVPQSFINISRLDYLKNNGYIDLIRTTDYYNLYGLREDLYRPLVYKTNIIRVENSSLLPNDIQYLFCENDDMDTVYTSDPYLSSFVSDNVTIEYKKINPTKYKIQVKNVDNNFAFILSQKYSKLWELKLPSELDKSFKVQHFNANGYLNGWVFYKKYPNDHIDNIYMTIYYKPQYYLYVGNIISIITLILLSSYFIYIKNKTK